MAARSGGPPPPCEWLFGALPGRSGTITVVDSPPTVQVALRSSAGGFWGVNQSKAPERSTCVVGSSELDRAGCGRSRQQTPCPWLLGARPVNQGQLTDSFTLIPSLFFLFRSRMFPLFCVPQVVLRNSLHINPVLCHIRGELFIFWTVVFHL